jgi:hypothetical protein
MTRCTSWCLDLLMQSKIATRLVGHSTTFLFLSKRSKGIAACLLQTSILQVLICLQIHSTYNSRSCHSNYHMTVAQVLQVKPFLQVTNFLKMAILTNGVSIQDLSLFVQKTLTFSFTLLDKSDASSLLILNDLSEMPNWQLTLGIIQTE